MAFHNTRTKEQIDALVAGAQQLLAEYKEAMDEWTARGSPTNKRPLTVKLGCSRLKCCSNLAGDLIRLVTGERIRPGSVLYKRSAGYLATISKKETRKPLVEAFERARRSILRLVPSDALPFIALAEPRWFYERDAKELAREVLSED